jgi:hypothetical protein
MTFEIFAVIDFFNQPIRADQSLNASAGDRLVEKILPQTDLPRMTPDTWAEVIIASTLAQDAPVS